jgi:HTH-type transcriptional regulator/antitoxin HipB
MALETRELALMIRDLRKKHGLSQGELAHISGVSLPTISRFEREKDTIRLDVLMKLLDALGYRLEITAKEKENGSI